MACAAGTYHGGHQAVDGHKVDDELWGLLLEVLWHAVDGSQPRIVHQDANLGVYSAGKQFGWGSAAQAGSFGTQRGPCVAKLMLVG